MKIATYQPMPPSAVAVRIVMTDTEVREAVFEYLARKGIEMAGPGSARFTMPDLAGGCFEIQLDAGAWINTIRLTE